MDLREIVNAATPGVWKAAVDDLIGGWCVTPADAPEGLEADRAHIDMCNEDDARFIATFDPTLVSALLDVVDIAREEAESGESYGNWSHFERRKRLRTALATLEDTP